jgi:cation diffusion facilitator CzcD-associated flavoprotein CzcO
MYPAPLSLDALAVGAGPSGLVAARALTRAARILSRADRTFL